MHDGLAAEGLDEHMPVANPADEVAVDMAHTIVKDEVDTPSQTTTEDKCNLVEACSEQRLAAETKLREPAEPGYIVELSSRPAVETSTEQRLAVKTTAIRAKEQGSGVVTEGVGYGTDERGPVLARPSHPLAYDDADEVDDVDTAGREVPQEVADSEGDDQAAKNHEDTVCGRVGGSTATGSAEGSRAAGMEADECARRRESLRTAGMSEDEIAEVEKDLASLSATNTIASMNVFWTAHPTPTQPENMVEFLKRQLADSQGRNAENLKQTAHQSGLVASLQEQCSKGRDERRQCQRQLLKEKLHQKKGGRAP